MLTLTRTLASLRSHDGVVAGGKGANLGELVAAGLPVPDGFVVTTGAYELAARAAALDPADPRAAGDRLRALAIPGEIGDQIRAAYRALGGGPVAVRSSATAEDLPSASFAGQQDTYLGTLGEDALLDAVRRCWASLWNERAVAYRRQNEIDDRAVGIAVVVQRMVDAQAAGVLFTADPIRGTRDRAVIDAAAGLGEAVVSGAVTPDHYVADPHAGVVLERTVRGDAAVLDDAHVLELARLGARIEALFGAPQDIEFAIDPAGRSLVLQSRPITTLFPLPERAAPAAGTRLYFSFNVAQGYFPPITPMGLQSYRLIPSAIAGLFGVRVPDPIAGPAPLALAGGRLYIDLTTPLRDPLGREILLRGLGIGEARSATVIQALARDERFAPRATSRGWSATRLLPRLVRSGIPRAVLSLVARPEATRDRYLAELEDLARVEVPRGASMGQRLDAVRRLLLDVPPRIFPRLIAMVAAGQLSYLAVRRLLGSRAAEDEVRALTRGAPHNPTTEMDLGLWALAAPARTDPAVRAALIDRTPAALAAAYRDRALPAALQSGLTTFLARYGSRAVGEIDLGVPRWREDPTHILGALANYARVEDERSFPDAVFARGAKEARTMAAELPKRVHGPKRLLVRSFLRRVRALGGLREVPKFTLVRLVLGPARELLLSVGHDLAEAGRIERADDVFFLDLPEARRAVAGEDVRAIVAERRASHARELRRRHIPRVLLSDGTDAEIAYAGTAEGGLQGTPASPGRVTARARVVLSPEGARLDPGDILVAPSTDPGWTPLFLTAGGLVMEMGGMMSHGAVVAREYGIPAVVGVPGATESIASGQRVTVDGSTGSVVVEDAAG